MPTLTAGRLLVGAVIAAFIGVTGLLATKEDSYEAHLSLSPNSGLIEINKTFVVDVVVESHVPANVFAGDIEFDPQILSVESIDYNTSLADLWAIRPWFDNGSGTINFGGGTTKPGGFVGQGTLLTITFKTRAIGESHLNLSNARILKHDGLGTELNIDNPIDAIFSIEPSILAQQTLNKRDSNKNSVLKIVQALPSTDLNNDGKQSFADISIFMVAMAKGELKADFDGDGSVGMSDLSILMSAK